MCTLYHLTTNIFIPLTLWSIAVQLKCLSGGEGELVGMLFKLPPLSNKLLEQQKNLLYIEFILNYTILKTNRAEFINLVPTRVFLVGNKVNTFPFRNNIKICIICIFSSIIFSPSEVWSLKWEQMLLAFLANHALIGPSHYLIASEIASPRCGGRALFFLFRYDHGIKQTSAKFYIKIVLRSKKVTSNPLHFSHAITFLLNLSTVLPVTGSVFGLDQEGS